ncbi:MAG: rRNA maturation RNase YbeY [Actinomycetes bacterium]
MTVDVANESGTPVDETALMGVCRYVLDRMGVHPLAELSVLLVDVATMEALHVRWMDEPGPTDVLAFPMDELPPGRAGTERSEPGPELLGDVVLCPEVAERQGAEAGHGRQAELELLATHGVLHLLGYDHADPEEHAEMFGLQERLLTEWREQAQAGGAART